jgi:hypothetical protein
MHSPTFARGTNAESLPRFGKKDKSLREYKLIELGRTRCQKKLTWPKGRDDRLSEFFGACFAADVLRDVLALAVHFF